MAGEVSVASAEQERGEQGPSPEAVDRHDDVHVFEEFGEQL